MSDALSAIGAAGDTHAPLASQWARIGGGFAITPSRTPVNLERLVVQSARVARGDPRLFWVMLAWLREHGVLVNRRRLSRALDAVSSGAGDEITSATCGVLFGILAEVSPTAAKPWRALQQHCAPLREQRAMFDVVASNPVLTMIARDESLQVFRDWGFWHNEITDTRDAIRSLAGVLRSAPELGFRAALGADLAADVVSELATHAGTISDLARITGSTRAAVHETVTALVARGFVLKPRDGYRRPLTLAPGVLAWVSSFPLGRTPA